MGDIERLIREAERRRVELVVVEIDCIILVSGSEVQKLHMSAYEAVEVCRGTYVCASSASSPLAIRSRKSASRALQSYGALGRIDR